MKIDYMREYIELVNNLNFTDTASKLYITQPALSRHIATIEEEMGVQLLVRTKHNVSPTVTGVYVHDEFQNIIKQYDNLREKVDLISSGVIGEIKIGMLYYAIDKYYNPVVKHFKENFTSIKLSLFSCQSNMILPMVLNDEIDIGNIFSTVIPDVEGTDLYKISNEKLVIMVSDKHPLAKKDSVNISEIKKERIIIFPYEKNFSQDLLNKLRSYGIKEFFYADKYEQIDTLPFLLQETNGMVLVPNHLKNMKRSNIKFIEINDNDFCINSYFVYKKNIKNPAIQIFVKNLDKIYK